MMRTAAGLSLAAVLFTVIASSCSSVPEAPRSTLPPANAEPGEVVANYLQALVDGDCAKARALMTADGTAYQKPFCDRPRVTSYSELSAEGARPSSTEAVYAVQVQVEGADISLGDGEHTMFVQVLLQPGGVWRVTGLGSGP
jgi:hypothetical protein